MVENTSGLPPQPGDSLGPNAPTESAATSLARGLSTRPQGVGSTDLVQSEVDSDWLRSAELGERRRVNLSQVEALDHLRESLGEEGAPKVHQGYVQRIGDILTGSSGRLREKVGLEIQSATVDPQPTRPATLWERLWGRREAISFEPPRGWSAPSLSRLFADPQFFDQVQSHAWQSLSTAQFDLAALEQKLQTQGTILQLEGLSQELLPLQALPASFKAMSQMDQMTRLLRDLPRQMEGLEQLQTLSESPTGWHGLKTAVEKLQGLDQLALHAPDMPGHFGELKRAVDSLQQLAGLARELPGLPDRLEKLGQALPTPAEGPIDRPPIRLKAELEPFHSTPISDSIVKLSQSLQRTPVLARQFGDLSRMQAQLERSLAELQKVTSPGALLPLEKLVGNPQGMAHLQATASTAEERAQLERFKGLVQPVLQGDAAGALKSLAGPDLQGFKLDAPAGLEAASQLLSPELMASMEKVALGIAEAREIQRSTQAQQRHMNSLPEVADFGDLGESLAQILQEAQATHRPRTLFGIPLGGARPANVPTPAQAAPPTIEAPKESLSKARVDAYRQTYPLLAEQLIYKGNKDHPWVLVYHARDAESAKGLADTLESTVVKGGSSKMQSWLAVMTQTADSALALSAILDHVAQVVPDRMMGILLLTTDGEGGKDAVRNALHKMAGNLDSSLRLADFLETSSRHPMAARGVAELLDSLTEPQGEDWSGAERIAEVFRGMSETVGGARRLNQMLENLAELEGGHRMVSRTLNRMTRTPEGAQALLETLQNLAHDQEGSALVGRLLARSSESREGGRELLLGLQRMLSKPAGGYEVASLLVSLAEGGQGARLLANWAKDPTNAAYLSQIFQQLGENEGSRLLLGYALQQMTRQRLAFGDFAGLLSKSKDLAAAVSLTGWDYSEVSQSPASEVDFTPEREEKKKPFRPADVYSRATLRQARICGECGGRTSLLGWCSRCST